MNTNNKSVNYYEISIIGDGFAGLNLARILSKNEIKCALFGTGFGASNFWAGTFDLLKYEGENLIDSYSRFQRDYKNHPYSLIQIEEMKSYLSEFFDEFNVFNLKKNIDSFENKRFLTILGTLKPSFAAWHSIFSIENFKHCNMEENKKILIIDFLEFNNSAMDLVSKGMKEYLDLDSIVLKISFLEFISKINKDSANKIKNRINENSIGKFFDENRDKLDIIRDLIKVELNDNFETTLSTFSTILFPPILGIEYNKEIINSLEEIFKNNLRVYEIVAASPSLISKRLQKEFNERINETYVKNYSRYTLEDINFDDDEFVLDFSHSKNKNIKIISKNVIFCFGSLFKKGIFAIDQDNLELLEVLEKIGFPENSMLDNNLQLKDKQNRKAKIYVCGSALYQFMGNLSDEEEIKFNSGLGLAIVSSSKIAHILIDRMEEK